MPTWDTQETDGYDSHKFYTQASDRKGHAAKIQVKLPTNIAGEIARLVQSGVITEYSTSQAFIRDAVIHRLETVNQWIHDGRLEKTISMWTIHNDALRKTQERETFQSMMREIGDHCQHLLNTGRQDDLRDYVENLLGQAITIPVEFRTEFIGDLEGRLKLIGGL